MEKINSASKPVKIVALIALLLGLFVLYDLSPLGGNIHFYSKWADCHQKPVGSNPEPLIGGGKLDYYGSVPTFSFMRLQHQYFCTPLEAEQAGYSASPSAYDFPHLNQQQREEVIDKKLK